MTKMKESGIDWIGQIPEEWEVIKFKYLGDVKQGLTYSPSDIVDKDEGILVLRSGNIQNGVLDFTNNVYVKTKVAESIVLRKNDILITARNGSSALIGKNAIIDTDIKATFGAFMMVFRTNKSLIAKFAFYLMNVSFNFYRTFFTTSTVNQLTAAIFNGIEVPLPSISEQQKIADFLDKKTAQLDKVKSLLEEQIQKLKDYRASLIYETVTKGLDKTVPMKDSGIDWIGQVPEGWEMVKFKYFFNTSKGLSITKECLVDEGIPVINYGQIHSSMSKQVQSCDFRLPFVPDYYLSKKGANLNQGDFVFADTSEDLEGAGNFSTRIDSTGPLLAGYHTIKARLNNYDEYDFRYFMHLFDSLAIRKQIQNKVSGIKVYSITQGILNSIFVIIPPKSEQQKIANLLDEKTAQIDKLVQIKNQQIENINKQRQTLIYDYVTGKRRG
ncbi:restriction endonuclease subunit S [Streptococcus oralis]|uniref:Type-1 restriction enzyme EcoKI specificity protein n=1 Tax=Streptococcus oralis TaxID=1303 RepID=A0A3R9I371_STROR|nr:restriction endonuclease subunit S [Streptococcus oralis]RSI69327.1 Type-1 restriction enzyme EcoKI specificity protein [Streptococcus oralis]